MKIMIIGKNGFLAKSLIEYYSNKDSYTLDAFSHEELDALNESMVAEILKKGNYDIVFNTAVFRLHGKPCDKELEYDLRMFFNVAKYSEFYGKMIYFGSGAEYNKKYNLHSVREEDTYNEIPNDQYGFGKYIINKYIESSSNIFNLKLFGIYGKNEDYRKKFITGACAKAVLNLPLTMRQNAIFDFLYIDDFCELLDKFINIPMPKYHSYNFCTGKGVSLIDILEIVNKVSNKSLPIIICKDGLSNEYTGNNDRLLGEVGDYSFLNHELAIKALYSYFDSIKQDLDLTSLVYQG